MHRPLLCSSHAPLMSVMAHWLSPLWYISMMGNAYWILAHRVPRNVKSCPSISNFLVEEPDVNILHLAPKSHPAYGAASRQEATWPCTRIIHKDFAHFYPFSLVNLTSLIKSQLRRHFSRTTVRLNWTCNTSLPVSPPATHTWHLVCVCVCPCSVRNCLNADPLMSTKWTFFLQLLWPDPPPFTVYSGLLERICSFEPLQNLEFWGWLLQKCCVSPFCHRHWRVENY